MAKQTWKCLICGHSYSSPMRVKEVLCPKEHTAAQLATITGRVSDARGRAGRYPMTLVQGEMPTEPKRTNKKAVHGKQDTRRA